MTDSGSGPRVLISNRQSMPVDEAALTELARACLVGEGASDSELSLSFVTAEEIAELHAHYLGEEGPTDVLSFPLDDAEEGEGGGGGEAEEGERGVRILGDVVIAPDVAATNNPADPAAELRLLLVHGILHLLGHDHETESERAEMWARQERYSGIRLP